MIQLTDVWKVYPQGNVTALRGISLQIQPGEFVALMGPSGSGKSTLLHLFGALDRPTQGRVELNGTDLSTMSENSRADWRNRSVGFVFQMFNLVPTLTALENVELPMLFSGVSREARRARARGLLEKVGLGERLHHKPSELSGGEQQRVAIARALANDPQIILADEPTGNLDSESGRQILELLKQLSAEGKTILLVTHNPEAAAYAQRIIKLRDGRCVE